MEFIVELKHAFGIERGDQVAITTRAMEAYKDKDYKKVIELCSMLNWSKNPLSSDLAFALCFSIWHEPGNDAEIFEVAKRCVEFYDEPRFKEICSYAQEFWAKQNLKKAKELSPFKFQEEVEENVIKTFENALSWNHDNDNLKKRIKKGMLEAYNEIGERYYNKSLVFKDNWKEREDKKKYISWAIPYFKKAENNQKVSDLELKVAKLQEQISKDKERFGVPLNQFPEASGFCNKLMKAGYTTLGDFLRASDSDLDKISGIGSKTMGEIKAFRAKF